MVVDINQCTIKKVQLVQDYLASTLIILINMFNKGLHFILHKIIKI